MVVARTLGEPALFAIMLSAVVSAVFFTLGVVAEDALGLTPLVYLLAGVFFVVTTATYVEGSSLHIERGGASTFARYAFDEFWSFVAGWAILLDYLIVMAIGSFAVSHYLAAFWGELRDPPVVLVPGYTGTKEDFAPLLRPLCEASLAATSASAVFTITRSAKRRSAYSIFGLFSARSTA